MVVLMVGDQERQTESGPAWLLEDDRVIASVEMATTVRRRSKGLLGRQGIDGALLIEPAMSVHTIGMKFAIDVAYCRRKSDSDEVLELDVLEVATMVPNRVGRPRPRSRIVLEAQAGAMSRWGVEAGRQLQVRTGRGPA